ncbi:MAG: NAD(P)-dependent alcohol dehydrogenase [Longimicrobiales bacterium]
MHAVTIDRYGPPDVFRYEEVETPVPGPGEVRVRVHATATAAGDWHLMRGDPLPVRLMFGLLRPRFRILGAAAAGTVEAVGSGVDLSLGAPVFGDLSDCGFGGFAEYVCVPADALLPKPDEVSFEEAAAAAGSAVTALQALRAGGEPLDGANVLVNGASGGVGTYAVQIARALGAEVTGVCSTRNVELVRSLGASRVVDYTREDFTEGGATYDRIVDAAAYRPLSDNLDALRPGGRYVFVGGAMGTMYRIMLFGPLAARRRGVSITLLLTKVVREDLATVADLLASGRVRSVIDRTYPLPDVAAAVGYVEEGHARGKVVVVPTAP